MEKIALAIYGQPYGELPLFERCAVAWAYASQYVSAAAMALSASAILETGAPKIARKPSPRYLSTIPRCLITMSPMLEKK